MKAIVCLILSLLLQPPSGQAQALSLSKDQWKNDLSYLMATIDSVHPSPYAKHPKAMFVKAADDLSRDIPGLTDSQIAARMMQIVALLGDGHSHLAPIGLNRWFPVRCYLFTDGLFITAIEPAFKEYAGSRVLKIGSLDVKNALALAQTLKGSDNRFGEMENCVMYLFNADLLEALGAISDANQITLEVERPGGTVRTTITLRSQTVEKQSNWMEWGEMYGPVPDLMTSFGQRVSSDFRKGDTDLPLHLRMRLPYWFEYLAGSKSVYFQFNFVEREWNQVTFEEFTKRLFSFIDANEVRKFIIDIRYNSGGDGSLLDPFLHEIIKRDKINRKGTLFVLVGRKTFSAAVMLIGSLKRHTNAYFVGEPAGAPLNHRGEAQSYILPNSKFVLQLSTLYYQVGGPQDRNEYFQVDFPSQFSSRQYFSGADPALELVLRNDLRSLCDALLEDRLKAETALGRVEEMKKEYDWYSPFSETDMNATGYLLLRAGRIAESIAAFLLNAKSYPGSWNAWDSLAEAYMKAGNIRLAIENYEKSLKLNPGNQGARQAIEKMAGAKRVSGAKISPGPGSPNLI